MIEPRLG